MSDANISDDQPLPPSPSYSDTTKPAEPTGPTMSTGETLTGIFFEPGRTFEALRQRPKFLVAGIIIIVLIVAFNFILLQRMGYENLIRSAIENSPQAANMSPEQMDRAVGFYTGPIGKAIAYGAPVVVLAVIFAAGAALYLLGAMLMGKKLSYKQALSVWVYSSFPPVLVGTLLNFVLLFLKSRDDIDPQEIMQRGSLVHANLGFIVSMTEHPILGALLNSLDLLAFYGLFLAALGLRKVARLSSGSAWGIVLSLWLLNVLYHMGKAALTGTP
ncbi:MAG: hypothetical protein AUG51_20375 [Acidobacteria bacterium 13_1_20CM_3_53_8]|nr:MAG: hypothetical protein AUG51_20375 [Acidobacteria bacterium 13_1_20CM_3_53_8]